MSASRRGITNKEQRRSREERMFPLVPSFGKAIHGEALWGSRKCWIGGGVQLPNVGDTSNSLGFTSLATKSQRNGPESTFRFCKPQSGSRPQGTPVVATPNLRVPEVFFYWVCGLEKLAGASELKSSAIILRAARLKAAIGDAPTSPAKLEAGALRSGHSGRKHPGF